MSCLFMQTHAQNSGLLGDGAQDYIRRQQLLEKVDLGRGLTTSSFYSGLQTLDTLLPGWKGKFSKKIIASGRNIITQILPFSATMGYDSHHPTGANDGAMIPARGGQALISAGFRVSAGGFSVQLKPEFVYAQNTAFETFPTEHYDYYWWKYYQLINKIDNPESFGTGAYQKFFPGQSAIRYTKGNVSVGVSTESSWWGPGRYNALVMSNHAPGFLHFVLNTVKPIETPVGSFEGELIAGTLSSSGVALPDTNRYYNGFRLYQPKKEESRYMTGITITWQPKWVKGLYLGFANASYLYQSDINGITDILPLEGFIHSPAAKNGLKGGLGSIFARYVMPKERAELYFEFGRNDKVPNLFNLVVNTEYPRAYVAGFRKLFATRKKNQFIEFASEFTQMQLPTADLIRVSASWYTHPYVRQGYTNQGQILGASIGPGSNSQLLDISWVNGINKAGLKFERIVRNNDYYYNSFIITQDFTRHWIDVSTTLHADWQYKQFLFSTQMSLMRSLNYEWFILPGLGYFKNGYDFLNFHSNISVSYRL